MQLDLLQTPLFAGVTEEELPKLLHCLDAQERSFQRGEVILLEGTTTEQIGVVLEGMALVELGDVWGGNSVLGSIGPGETFAEAYACIPGEQLMISVTAAEDTTVLLLRASRLFTAEGEACALHGKLIRNLLMLNAGKNLQLSRRMQHTGPKTIRGRLLSYFSECIKRTGRYTIEIPYNRRQLADYLGVDRSALCNELSKMQRDGLLQYEKNRFTLSSKAAELA